MNAMVKKLLLFLLALGFLTTQVWAQYDDDDDDYEDEDEDVKKTSKVVPKRAVSSPAKKDSRNSRDNKESKESNESRGDAGGFKVGFYGSIATSGIASISGIGIDPYDAMPMGHAGVLFNLGNDLEVGLGVGFSRSSGEADSNGKTVDSSLTMYEIVPSAYYQLGKGNLVSYGPGLDFHLGSWSIGSNEETKKDDPGGFHIALFPNFQLKAEIVKDFQAWLKTGVMFIMPANDEDDGPQTSMIIGLRTSVGVSFYL